MLIKHPKQYGDRVEWAESGKMSIPDIPLPIILIFLQWSNVEGIKHTFGEEEKFWFNRIRKAFGRNMMDVSIGLMCNIVSLRQLLMR